MSEHFPVNPGTTYAVAANPRSPKRLVAVGLISIREQNGDNRWRRLDTENIERGVEIMAMARFSSQPKRWKTMSEIFSFEPSERGTRIFASEREPKEVLFCEGEVRIKDAADPDAEWVELTRKRIDKAVDLGSAGKVMVLPGDELT